MRKRCAGLTTMVAIALATFAAPVAAQLASSPAPTAEPTQVPDPLGRDTPRGAVRGLLEALRRGDYERAAQFINSAPVEPTNSVVASDDDGVSTPEVPSTDIKGVSVAGDANGEVETAASVETVPSDLVVPATPSEQSQIARRLQVLLDRFGSLTAFNQLSGNPAGAIDDGLPLDVEQVGKFAARQDIPIYFVRSPDETGPLIWRLSRQTIEDLEKVLPPEAQERLVEHVEKSRMGAMVAGAPLRDWLILIGGALVSFGLFWLVANVIVSVLRRFIADPEASILFRIVYAAVPPLSLLLMVTTFGLWSVSLDASIVARQAMRDINGLFGVAAVFWFLLRIVEAGSRIAAARIVRQGGGRSLSAVRLFRRAARTAIILLGAVFMFDALGFDVTTGIAALGIGGLAIALGAQKLVENLVGGVSVVADKPVQIGDFCRVGDIIGTVEDIGMRSTRIRTLDKSVVTIPNADLASQRIENLSERDRFLFAPVIGLDYETPTAGLRQAVQIIEAVLAEHPRIDHETSRVHLSNFGESSLDIKVFCYILVSDFAESRTIWHQLLLDIHERLTGASLSLALPINRVRIISESAQ